MTWSLQTPVYWSMVIHCYVCVVVWWQYEFGGGGGVNTSQSMSQVNLRPGGGGGHFAPPPLWFFKDNSKTKGSSVTKLGHTFSLINFTSVVKFLCRGHIRSGHQVESRDLTSKKVYARATATVLNRIFSSFQNLIRPLVPTICISRIFDISMTWGQVKILTSPL